jgi:hypothetical protein
MASIYGMDVTVFSLDGSNVLATFESIDVSIESVKKESQAAKDKTPKTRTLGQTPKVSVSCLLEGSGDSLMKIFMDTTQNRSIGFTYTDPATANTQTLLFNNCVCTSVKMNIGSDVGKESLDFEPGDIFDWDNDDFTIT